MPIIVQCPNPACRQSCSVADTIGGPIRCPKCDKPFVVKPTLDGQRSDTNKNQPSTNTNPFPVLPAEFGRYRVLRLLGKGGMGAVYLAEDSQLGRQAALKIPFFDASEAPQRAERFVREARSAAALHHPNICTVFDAGQIDGRPFLTMAYIAGKPLEDEIDPDVPMPQIRAAEIARKVALALEHAHRKGIVHRDLKPANVMLTADDGEPVVMDFGLAKRFGDMAEGESKLTRLGGIVGTPSYMSPEQVKGEGKTIGPPTDIYSLGVVLFEMLTGDTPYRGAFRVIVGQILAAPVPPVKEFRADVDSRLDAICRKAMAKEPSARFASMAEFADALGQYLKAPKSSPPPLSAPLAILVPQAPPRVADRSPFGDLVGATARAPAAKKAKRRRTVAIAVALALLLPLVGWLAVVVLHVETPNGTLVVEMNDDEVEARIKNGKLILSGPDGKVRYTLTAKERRKKVEAGPYKIRVEGADGLVLDTPEFTLKKGGEVKVRVTLEQKAVEKNDPPAKPDEPVKADAKREEQPAAPRPADLGPDRRAAEYVLSIGGTVRVNDEVDDIKGAAALPPDAFRLTYVDLNENLKVRNAGLAAFKGCKHLTFLRMNKTPVKDQGLAYFKDCKNLESLHLWVTQISETGLANFKDCKNLRNLICQSTQVSDLSPLKDMKLTSLDCKGTPVKDLSPLKGMNLVSLSCTNTQVSDLSPLKNMNLTHLDFANTRVPDLTLLKDMKLTHLDCNNTPVSDLSPLKGMPLTTLNFHHTQVSDLTPLKGMPLTHLECWNTRVSDLSPLKDMKWTALDVSRTGVSDLSPLKDMKLTKLLCEATRVSDLTPLRGMPLTELYISLTGVSDLSPLADMKLAKLYCNLTQVTGAGLAPLQEMSSLRWLEVGGPKTTDAGLKYLEKLTNLEVLCLYTHREYPKGPLTGAALVHLKGMTKLRILRLDHTEVTDEGLVHLNGLLDLRQLWLHRTRVTDKGVDKLKATLPNCNIGR